MLSGHRLVQFETEQELFAMSIFSGQDDSALSVEYAFRQHYLLTLLCDSPRESIESRVVPRRL